MQSTICDKTDGEKERMKITDCSICFDPIPRQTQVNGKEELRE